MYSKYHTLINIIDTPYLIVHNLISKDIVTVYHLLILKYRCYDRNVKSLYILIQVKLVIKTITNLIDR